MKTKYGHLTYCTNIHAGESWENHFAQLQEYIPVIKQKISPDEPFGIGLRLSDNASLELIKERELLNFQQWLSANDCYVFTMNGFPYGGFHRTVVKDKVHAPDWTSEDRVDYTIRLAKILSRVLPDGMEGGISTSPLTYRFWHSEEQVSEIFMKTTLHLLQVVDQLIQIKQTTGKLIHIDIEPEPDGLLGDGKDFLDWYSKYLVPLGIPFISKYFGCSEQSAELHIRQHIQLCYDVCHFAVGFEDHVAMIQELKTLGIRTGKIQISAALRAELPENPVKRNAVITSFSGYNEPVYLHQVVALQHNGQLKRYRDLPDALNVADPSLAKEWRAHFHVPVFEEKLGLLRSTQKDIEKVVALHKQDPFTSHLEVETYTWEVLPEAQKLPVADSIIREMQWVKSLLADNR